MSQTRYQKYVTLKDRFGWTVSENAFSVESPMEFLREMGFPSEEVEGGSTSEHFELLDPILEQLESSEVSGIAEIGFNAGGSSEQFLSRFRNARITSFDIGLHPYVGYAKLYLDKKYPKRHQLILGDSLNSVPKTELPLQDIIFIDGNHLYDYARQDILNCQKYADAHTLLIIDNVVPHRGQGSEVYRAYRELVDEGILVHEEFLVFKEGKSGIAIAHYRDKSEPQIPIPREQISLIERYIPIYDATRALEQATSLSELEQAYKKGAKLIRDDPTFISKYRQLRKILEQL